MLPSTGINVFLSIVYIEVASKYLDSLIFKNSNFVLQDIYHILVFRKW